MRAVDVIIKKRGGRALTPDEIRFVIDGAAKGAIPDYQTSALLMAILLRGMNAWITSSLDCVNSGIDQISGEL